MVFPLNFEQLNWASDVGVQKTSKIRMVLVPNIIEPENEELKQAAAECGLITEKKGMTFGYTFFIKEGCYSKELVSHELRHVYQYEIHGGIECFLPKYLASVAEDGYPDSKYEIDARNYEL
jgi:hypothetical protein